MNMGIRGNLRAAMIAVLLLVLASVAVMIRAGQLLTRVSGATNLASDAQDHVWLSLNGELLRLTPAGAIEAHFDLAPLGIETAVAMVPMPDGSLWVGGRSGARLYLLSANGQRLAAAEVPLSAGPIFGIFHAAYEPGADRLIVSDTQNDRLLAFSGSGQYLASSGSELMLHFPNGLSADRTGALLLADTNHHVLKRIRPDLSLAPGSIEAPGPFEQDHRIYSYSWPVLVSVAADGGRYASWHAADLRQGAVVAYAADGHYLHSIPLGQFAEPQGLLARTNDVLVAVRSGESFSLRRFDRQGAELDAFGDSALQARLAEASARAGHLRRLQKSARLVLLLGALGLLVCALRLRRQGELAAAGAVVSLRREVPREGLAVTLVVLAGVFILIMSLQLGGLGLGLHLARDARHSGSHGLMLLALLGIPLLMGLVLFGVAIAWRSTRIFLDMQTGLMQRRMQSWTPYLSAMLAAGEQIEDFGIAPSLWRGRLLIATNRRLLLLLASAGYSRKPLWQAHWQRIHAPRVLPRSWWLRLLNPVSSVIEIEADGLERSLRLYSLNRWHSGQLRQNPAARSSRRGGSWRGRGRIAAVAAGAACCPVVPAVPRSRPA